MFETNYTKSVYREGIKFTQPSLTTPDMSLTVRQLLDRFTQGMYPDVTRDGEYDEEPMFDEIGIADSNTHDPLDLLQLQDEIKRKLFVLDNHLKDQKVQLEASRLKKAS